MKQAIYDRFPGAELAFANGVSIRLVGLWWERPLDRTDEIHDANWFVAGFDVRAHGERRRIEHSLLSWELAALRERAASALDGKRGRWESLEQTVRFNFTPRGTAVALRVRVLGLPALSEPSGLEASRESLAGFVRGLAALETQFPVRLPPEERRVAREATLRRRAADPNFPSIPLGRPEERRT